MQQAEVDTLRENFRLEHHGSLVLVYPLTEYSTQWLEDHTDGTWWGNRLALVVEPRYVDSLMQGFLSGEFD